MINSKNILSLIKYRVSIAVTFTAITGYVVYTHSFGWSLIPLMLGVFLLASGSSALNEYQESEYDAKMERTQNRPIPSGEMSPRTGLLVSLLFLMSGLVMLYAFLPVWASILGFINVIWYNGIYTTLKRITAFAVVPGSLVGAIPAMIGWTGGGGYVLDPTIVLIGFFLFIWQVPHFWLLMLKYGKQYENAGFPTINQTMSADNLKTIIFVWVVATSISSVMIPLFLKDISLAFFLSIFVLNLVFVSFFVKMAFGNMVELNFRKSFISINIYMMLFMLALIVYHLV